MTNELTIRNTGELTTDLAGLGQAADEAASRHVFDDYRSRKAANTLKRQDGDLALFGEFLCNAAGGPALRQAERLSTDPAAWVGVTWGLVAAFVKWQLARGFAVGSVNVRLSTVKTYAKLALKAGTLDTTQYALIRAVDGYSHKEGKRVDEARELAGQATRAGRKKAEPVSITKEQAAALKAQPDTPQGRRDALLMHLLLGLGLRVGEAAGLTVDNFNLEKGELTFYRPKVDKVQTHKLNGALEAARRYLAQDALAMGPLFRGSRKDGRLHEAGWSERNMTARVAELGRAVGAAGLSAHDLRHYWATQAARNGTPIDRLQDAGGWSSPAMPLRYVEAAAIANEGVRLE
jgi:integrase